MTTYNAVEAGVSMVIVLHTVVGLTCSATLFGNGVSIDTLSVDFADNGGTAWPTPTRVIAGARETDPAQNWIGATATTRISNLLFYHQTTYDATVMAKLALEHATLPWEKPAAIAT
jgi:hypothetical protein